MPRNLVFLSLALIAIIFGSFIATDKKTASATTQPQVACHFDPSLPIGFEVQPAKAARPGECAVSLTVDKTFSIVAIQAKVLLDPIAASDDVRVWTNFETIDSARRFACTLVKGARLTHPGYLVATDLRCFTAMVIFASRN